MLCEVLAECGKITTAVLTKLAACIFEMFDKLHTQCFQSSHNFPLISFCNYSLVSFWSVNSLKQLI